MQPHSLWNAKKIIHKLEVWCYTNETHVAIPFFLYSSPRYMQLVRAIHSRSFIKCAEDNRRLTLNLRCDVRHDWKSTLNLSLCDVRQTNPCSYSIPSRFLSIWCMYSSWRWSWGTKGKKWIHLICAIGLESQQSTCSISSSIEPEVPVFALGLQRRTREGSTARTSNL